MIIGAAACIAAAGYGWYRYFAAKEKALLHRLEQMILDVRRGCFHADDISEYEISALENEWRRFLEDSSKSVQEQEEQKHLVQELISDNAHQTITPVSSLKLYTELLKEADTGQVLPKRQGA